MCVLVRLLETEVTDLVQKKFGVLCNIQNSLHNKILLWVIYRWANGSTGKLAHLWCWKVNGCESLFIILLKMAGLQNPLVLTSAQPHKQECRNDRQWENIIAFKTSCNWKLWEENLTLSRQVFTIFSFSLGVQHQNNPTSDRSNPGTSPDGTPIIHKKKKKLEPCQKPFLGDALRRIWLPRKNKQELPKP